MFNSLYLYKISCVLAQSFNAYIYSNGGSFTFYIFMIFNIGKMWKQPHVTSSVSHSYQINAIANETIKIRIKLINLYI